LPKPKPDQIIRHEYVLGKVERQMLEQTSTAYSINRVLNPIVAALSDVSFVATILSLYGVYLGFKWDLGSRGLDLAKNTVSELIGDFQDTYEEVKGEAYSIYNNIPELIIESLPGANQYTYQGLEAIFGAASNAGQSAAGIGGSFVSGVQNYGENINEGFTQIIGNLDLNPFDGDIDLNPFN